MKAPNVVSFFAQLLLFADVAARKQVITSCTLSGNGRRMGGILSSPVIPFKPLLKVGLLLLKSSATEDDRGLVVGREFSEEDVDDGLETLEILDDIDRVALVEVLRELGTIEADTVRVMVGLTGRVCLLETTERFERDELVDFEVDVVGRPFLVMLPGTVEARGIVVLGRDCVEATTVPLGRI